MTTGHVFIATSLDGFIARKDGDIDWLTGLDTSAEDHGYEAFIATVDGMVMGRGSFEKVRSFPEWPYEIPVIVMSRTLNRRDIPDRLLGRVSLSRLDPPTLMNKLENDGWKRAYIDGGRIIRSFLRAGLVKDMILTHVPILLGQGRPLFGQLDRDMDLVHLETRVFPSGLVKSHYRVAEA